MIKQNIKSKKGFTIIEVVLVLAIAGLIFLMVFVALPQLQRNQRDTQRIDDMARVQAALLNWQNNHSNNLPKASVFTASQFYDDEGKPANGGERVECNGNQACEFIRDYMNSAASETTTGGSNLNTFKDPDGEFYNIVITANGSKNFNETSLENTKFENKDMGGTDHPAVELKIDNKTATLDGDYDAYAMFIIPGATCEEDHAIQSTKNNFAVLYHMEGSGVKCTNNGS